MKRAARTPEALSSGVARIARVPFFESDAALVSAIRAGQPAGGAALYDRYHGHVRRVLLRVLGPEREIRDLVQDVFLHAIDGMPRLADANALRPFLTSIAVHSARGEIRRRRRLRWFPLFNREELPEVVAPESTPELEEALRTTYLLLRKLAIEERIAFALRFIDGMELTEVAAACGVSLATIKRRLARAETKFVGMARTYPALEEWLAGGTRWK